MAEVGSTPPVGQATDLSNASGSHSGGAGDNAKIQQAFAQGVVQFMGSMLQSMEGDVQQACDDDTSDPDAPT